MKSKASKNCRKEDKAMRIQPYLSHTGSSSSSDDDHFVVFFASPPDFADLSDDWSIVSVSTTKIELIDVSGGNGGTDYLTFEKN